jgi:uncharacterized protein (TIGR02594 family)
MLFTRSRTVLLLCSIAFFTTPAAAKTLRQPDAGLFSRGTHIELTDVSARRRTTKRMRAKHVARHHHPRRSHARLRRPVVAGSAVASAPDQRDGSPVVAEARRWIGTNPTGHAALWCAHFMNFVLERSGHAGSGSGLARSFASYGQRMSGPQVGAIAVMSRGRHGGHVGVVSGVNAKGDPIIISGNYGRRVAEAVFSRGRVYAYVMPSKRDYAVTHRDLAGGDDFAVDAAIGMAERVHQDARDRQIADGGVGIDLGRGTAGDPLDDLQPR